MTYLNIIATLLLLVLIGIAIQISDCINLLRILVRQITPSDAVVGDVDVKRGAVTLADTLIRKIRDIERQQFILSELQKKVEEIHDFNQLSPEQKKRINAFKNLSETLKSTGTPE
jgi:hypothetical protein